MAKEKGPSVDALGMERVRTVSPEESVNVGVRQDVPGGESKKGAHIQITGKANK